MRMHRLLATVLVGGLIGLVPFTASSATAAEPQARTIAASATTSAAPSAAADRAKPARRITIKFKATSRRAGKFVGKVQDATKKKVILVRSNSERGKYRPFRTNRTSKTGHYAFKNIGRVGYYKVKVASDKKYKTSFSNGIRLYYV